MAHKQADLFDYLSSGGRLYEYTDEALAKLAAFVPREDRLLDVGCGDGAITRRLPAKFAVGVDISPQCAWLCRSGAAHAVVGNAVGGLPFADASFGVVCCLDVLHHLGRQWEAIIGEADRVLRPGGTLVIVEPDARNPFVRWTQAPWSPIRVAPFDNEPAINPVDLLPLIEALGYDVRLGAVHVEGRQVVRSVFPLWQRLAKAPFVITLAWLCRGIPNKFSVVATKPGA